MGPLNEHDGWSFLTEWLRGRFVKRQEWLDEAWAETTAVEEIEPMRTI